MAVSVDGPRPWCPAVGGREGSRRRRHPLPAPARSAPEPSPRPRYGDDMEMAPPQIGRALVVVVDDRVSHGEREDNTGPLVRELLEEARLVVDGVVVVPGDTVAIRNALNTAVIGGVDLVITVGGTGVSPRDVTADATAGVLDRPIPGIAEAIRASGLAAGAVDAGLSRGLVGVSGSTLVVNLAPSRAAVRDGMATLTPLIRHVIAQLSGLDSAV
jgi:molybdenum cofactor synthesis domain-containing protein